MRISDFEKAAKSQEIQKKFKDIVNVASQVGDERPMSSCVIHHDNERVLTASRGGSLKLWNINNLSLIKTFYGPPEHAGHNAFHPNPNSKNVQLATCSGGHVNLWNLDMLFYFFMNL